MNKRILVCALAFPVFLTFIPQVKTSKGGSGISGSASQSNAAAEKAWHLADEHQAIVRRDEAVFTFPIPRNRQYEFWDRGILGIHVIKVRNRNEDFEVGFYIDNPLGGALGLGEGNLGEILGAPTGFFKAFKVGNRTLRDLNNVRVEGFASENLDQLTIRVLGTESVRRLFSGKSKFCTFESRVRDGRHSKNSVRVPVAYEP